MSIVMAESKNSDTIFLTRQETARELRVSVKQTYRMEEQGLLKPVRFGGRLVRFRADDVRGLGK